MLLDAGKSFLCECWYLYSSSIPNNLTPSSPQKSKRNSHTTASGYDGPWTPTPTMFNNIYFSLLDSGKLFIIEQVGFMTD